MLERLKSLRNHQGFMKYFKNTSWLFAEKVLRMVVGLFVGIWVARYLGPEQFGLFSYAQSFVGLFVAFATLGLDGIVIRELVKDESRRDELIGTAFWLKFFGAFCVLIVLAIVVTFTSNDTQANSLIFIIASATIFQSFNVIDMYFQSKVLSKYVVYANVLSLLFSSFLKIVLILNEAPLIAFAYVILFDSFVLAMGFLYFYKRNNLSIRLWKFDKEIALELLRDSWPLVLTTLIISIYAKLDQIMLKHMIDNVEVGYYSAAIRINAIFSFLPSIILISITPAIVNAKKVNNELFLERLQYIYNLFTLYSFLIIAFILFFGKDIILMLYGEVYSDSILILKIIVFSNLFSFLGAASSRWYMNCGFEKKILYRNLFGVFFNILGNFIFIPIYGAVGAAATTIISQVSANLIFDSLDKSTRVVFNQKVNSLLILFNLKYFLGKKYG